MEIIWDIVAAFWPIWLASYLVFMAVAVPLVRWHDAMKRKKLLKMTIELRAWRNVARAKRRLEILKAIYAHQQSERNAAP